MTLMYGYIIHLDKINEIDINGTIKTKPPIKICQVGFDANPMVMQDPNTRWSPNIGHCSGTRTKCQPSSIVLWQKTLHDR